jgi:N-acetylmuramoyl-L-alanine amidase
MKRIAIVVGHNARAQGAVRVTDGRTEFDWNGELAGLIQSHDPAGVRVFRREAGGGYSAEIDRVYAQVDAWGAALSIELHFNGAASAQANGCLMLSSGSKASMALAQALAEGCARVLGNTNRGVRVVGRQDRGGRSLWQGRAPAVLTEPYFGSNPAECVLAQTHMDELAEAHYRAARALVAA